MKAKKRPPFDKTLVPFWPALENTDEERDLAAWLIVRSCPAQYEVLTEMLGIPDPILA